MTLPAAATAPLTLALALALAFGANRAEAQYFEPYTHGIENSSSTGIGSFSTSTATYFPSYSYWTAAYYGYPPRVYIGYGSNDFPYYGRPYGSPTDPWSWPAMAGHYSAVPTRYNLMGP